MTIFDQGGNKLKEISLETGRAELPWFFDHRYQIESMKSEATSLCVFTLDTLGAMGDLNSILEETQ